MNMRDLFVSFAKDLEAHKRELLVVCAVRPFSTKTRAWKAAELRRLRNCCRECRAACNEITADLREVVA